jgi:hypothetical protein
MHQRTTRTWVYASLLFAAAACGTAQPADPAASLVDAAAAPTAVPADVPAGVPADAPTDAASPLAPTTPADTPPDAAASDPPTSPPATPSTPAAPGSPGAAPPSTSSYDSLVLTDHPVAFWDLQRASGTEADLSGNGNTGTYRGGIPAGATMPNGDAAADFDGSSQYLTIPSSGSMSIPTTGNLTWEGWIRPDVLQFPNSSGYVDWMGKCAQYSPTCEWEARLYNTTNPQNRCNRFSAYAFNPSAGLGSGADWQPVCGLIQPDRWYHVVGEYTTLSQPSTCSTSYPGSLNIWVNGVLWSQASHNPTGCMSQYSVTPRANDSPLNIGTMALDKWFKGAIGKVAIYNYLLDQSQITKHYQTMTGQLPTGSCGNTCTF